MMRGFGGGTMDGAAASGALNALNATCAARRARVLDALGSHGALLVPASPELVVGPDGELRYVPDADLYWLTGYTEPEAVLVLCPSADTPFTLFVRPRDPKSERWTGVRGGVEAARDVFGADAAHPIAELNAKLPGLLASARTLYAPVALARADVREAVRVALVAAQRARQRSGRGLHTVTDLHVLLAPMRLRKDEYELMRIRRAAEITIAGFHDAVRAIRDAHGEWQVEAALEHGFRSRGAFGSAFAPIVAGGANATVLHYIDNAAPLRKDDLLLIDAGARFDMYCADVTRTFPVSGAFSPEQRDIYDVVHAAYEAARGAAAPGRAANDIHDAALRTLVRGMLDLGLLRGNIDDIIENREHEKYYPHRTSHWLGLDVHDAGAYVLEGGDPLPLEAGMVLTIEPGLYIPADDDTAPAALRGIGVRLEDDVVITDAGHEVLTVGMPLAAREVESLFG